MNGHQWASIIMLLVCVIGALLKTTDGEEDIDMNIDIKITWCDWIGSFILCGSMVGAVIWLVTQ